MRLLLYFAALVWAGPSFAIWSYGGVENDNPATLALYVCGQNGGSSISGGTTVPEVSYTYQCMDEYGPHGDPTTLQWVVPEVSCTTTLNVSLSGTLSRTGEPSATNIPDQMVCHEGCGYALSSAVPATGLDGTLLWSGTWIGTGAAEGCSTGSDPTPGGNTAEGAAADNATKAATDAEAAHQGFLDGMLTTTIAQRSTPSDASPIGSFFGLPTWITSILEPGETDCKLHIDLGPNGPLGFVSAAVADTDVCGIQYYADTYGNWFVWFCAVLWSWAIVTGSSTAED